MSANTIPYNGPASTDANGVLTQIIQQVSDQSPYYNWDKGTYRPKFKGPYATLKECQNTGGKWLNEALATFGISCVSRFSHPTPPEGYGWWVAGARIEETEAGDHAILTLECEARSLSLLPGGQPESDPYQDTWQLRWEAYTVRPQAFCSNEPHSDYSMTDSRVQEDEPLPGPASREHVDMFVNGSDKGVSKGHRWYCDNQGTHWYMNDAESYVTTKALEDKSALWHYPVLMHTTVENHYVSDVSAMLSNNVKYDVTIGDKIDYIVGGSANPSEAPEGCPYTFPSDPKWVWVKTGDDMQHSKSKKFGKVTFQRTETFMGVISADVNYYGDVAFNHNNLSACRWIPGAL